MSEVYQDGKGQWRLKYDGKEYGPFASQSLAELLGLRKADAISALEYEQEHARILAEELGIGVSAAIAPAPKLASASAATVVPIVSTAAARAAEEKRIRDTIEAARGLGRYRSALPSVATRPEPVSYAKTVVVNGEVVRQIMSDDDVAKAVSEQAAKAAAAQRSNAAPIIGNVTEIPHGWEIHKGVLRPIPKGEPTVDPIVTAVRDRFKAGEFGDPKSPDAQAKARAEIARLKAEKPAGSMKACPICKGNPDKILGKLCACNGKGMLGVAVPERHEAAVDYVPEDAQSMSYVAYLAAGGQTTIHADNGTKAIRGACQSLRSAATGFERVKLDSGVMLILPDYDTQCPACHGSMRAEGKTCQQCRGGFVSKVGARFYFGPECHVCKGRKFTISRSKDGGQEAHPCKVCNETGVDPVSPEDRAHDAGLAAMTEPDPTARCGREKCKGDACFRCRDMQLGGYQRPGYVKCGPCRGKGKIDGDDCPRCRGKGYFTTTEVYRISPDPLPCPKCYPNGWNAEHSSRKPNPSCMSCKGEGHLLPFRVSDEITRKELLAEDRAPKRDRNIAVKLGSDTVYVGAGAVPSRKAGAVLHRTGTAKNRFDQGRDKSDKAGGFGGWNMRCRNYVATFSGG